MFVRHNSTLMWYGISMLNTSSKIIFTTNLTDLPGNNINKLKDGYFVGKNMIITKKIIVYLSGDPLEDLIVIQHELLHSIVVSSRDEFFVEDMAQQDVALKIKPLKIALN